MLLRIPYKVCTYLIAYYSATAHVFASASGASATSHVVASAFSSVTTSGFSAFSAFSPFAASSSALA
jgi:hypothetical protein